MGPDRKTGRVMFGHMTVAKTSPTRCACGRARRQRRVRSTAASETFSIL